MATYDELLEEGLRILEAYKEEVATEYDGCPHCIEELHNKGARCRRGCRCSCHGRD